MERKRAHTHTHTHTNQARKLAAQRSQYFEGDPYTENKKLDSRNFGEIQQTQSQERANIQKTTHEPNQLRKVGLQMYRDVTYTVKMTRGISYFLSLKEIETAASHEKAKRRE